MEYLFSDKTGTLTENVMQFHHCSVAGRNYKEVDGELRLHDHRGRGDAALQKISPQMQVRVVWWKILYYSVSMQKEKKCI